MDLQQIVTELESQRDRISQAIAALENDAPRNGVRRAAGPAKAGTTQRSGGITPEGRRRLSRAMKRRWAAKRAATGTSKRSAAALRATAPAKKRGGLTAAGRKRLSDMMKKRWEERRKKTS